MSTFYVRKNGSGTHTTIQGAIYDAVNGDTINIGEGTFYENVEIYKNVKLIGAGKDKTIIQGKLASDTMTCSWFAGDSILLATSTAVAQKGKFVSGTSITTSRIAEVISSTQIRLQTATPSTGNYTKTVAAYQTVAFSVAPISGTFKLRYNGVDTASIAWNATAATIQTALRAISGLSTVVVTGSISSKLLTITFDGVATPVAALSVSINALAPSTVVTPTLIQALVSGSSTVILPNTTSVAIGHKVEGVGVDATITAWNSATKTATLSSPITQTGSGVVLAFRLPRTNVAVTQISSPSSSSGPASIMMIGSTDGVEIKNLKAIGFDGVVGQEASALFFTAGTAPGHTNFLIDNCQFTADGDSAVITGSNPYLSNGTFQNCIIDGKTFTGSEPADVPSFSTYTANAIVKSIGASSSVFTFSDMRGIIVGRTFTAASSFASSATVTAISGNDVTINKVSTVSVGQSVTCTFTLTAYGVPNCARNLFYIGQNTSPNNTSNITFKNNLVSGQTGAVISATGSKSMFNTAVTIESVGGLVENNIIDGIFGAGDPNPLMSNSAIRCRQAGIVVQNNTNKTSGGRGNSGFLVSLGTSTNNQTVDRLLVEVSQSASNTFVESIMEKGALKAISKVSSDAVFSNESNWNLVNYVFKHDSSSRRLVSSFRSTFDSSKKTKLKANMKIGDKFELQKIIISKADRTLLVLKRNEISGASSFDFTLLADGPVSSGGGSQPAALITRTFSEASPGAFANELGGYSTAVISNGSLTLSATDSNLPWWNFYTFDIPTSMGTATQFTGSISYKMKLTISGSDLKSGAIVYYAGGYGAPVSKTISQTDISNGYVEISGLYIRPQYNNQLAIKTTGAYESISLSVSKLEISLA